MSDFTDVKRPHLAEPPATAAAQPRAPGGSGKLIAIAAAVVVAFAAGVVLGVIYMGLMGYHLSPLADASSPQTPPGGSVGTPPAGGGMPPAPGGMGGMRGPSPKAQLAQLVSKLDVLTAKPLSVQLTAAQSKQIQEQLKGLADAKELADDDAKVRLEKLLDVLKDQKETFEAAGYRWPGEGGRGGGPPGGMGGGAPPANPFTTDTNANHLKSLSERLEKGGNG
jgi:hypothetical protein